MILPLIEAAVAAGARRGPACRLVGLSVRTVERWRTGPDGRRAPRPAPSAGESAHGARARGVLAGRDARPRIASCRRIRSSRSSPTRAAISPRSPRSIGSSAKSALLQHRGRAKAPVRRPPRAHVATGPNQLWSWDITYLRTPVRGVFGYLYLMLDVWSRKIVGWAVHDVESAEHAAALFLASCRARAARSRGHRVARRQRRPDEGRDDGRAR